MQPGPFTLFCLYYLGISPEGDYQFVNANQVARQLNWTVDELMAALKGHGIHPDTVLNTDFPMARHQVDIQIAAEAGGRDQLRALAEAIYEQFIGAAGKKRDWLKEIEAEREAEREAKRNRGRN